MLHCYSILYYGATPSDNIFTVSRASERSASHMSQLKETVLLSLSRILWLMICFLMVSSLTIYFGVNYYRNVTVVRKTNKAYREAARRYNETHLKHKNRNSSSPSRSSNNSDSAINSSTCGPCPASITSVSKQSTKSKSVDIKPAQTKVDIVALKQANEYNSNSNSCKDNNVGMETDGYTSTTTNGNINSSITNDDNIEKIEAVNMVRSNSPTNEICGDEIELQQTHLQSDNDEIDININNATAVVSDGNARFKVHTQQDEDKNDSKVSKDEYNKEYSEYKDEKRVERKKTTTKKAKVKKPQTKIKTKTNTKKMAFYSIEYSKDEIKLLETSGLCLILNVLAILLMTSTNIINVQSNFTIDMNRGLLVCTVAGGIMIMCSRYAYKWVLIDMLVVVLKSSAYQCDKKTITILRYLIIFVCLIAVASGAGVILVNIKGDGFSRINLILVASCGIMNFIGTVTFHFTIWWIYLKKSYQIAQDLSKHNVNSNTKKTVKTIQFNRAKQVLLNTCVRFVVVTGFLAFTELVFFCLLILVVVVPDGVPIIGPVNLSFSATANCLVIVLLAPFSLCLYDACCAMIHKCCKKCFRHF